MGQPKCQKSSHTEQNQNFVFTHFTTVKPKTPNKKDNKKSTQSSWLNSTTQARSRLLPTCLQDRQRTHPWGPVAPPPLHPIKLLEILEPLRPWWRFGMHYHGLDLTSQSFFDLNSVVSSSISPHRASSSSSSLFSGGERDLEKKKWMDNIGREKRNLGRNKNRGVRKEKIEKEKIREKTKKNEE